MILGALILSGCSTTQPHDYIGQTLAQVEKSEIPGIIYDLSKPILERSPTYNGNADGSSWMVIAACAGPTPNENLVVAVLPAAEANSAILRSAKNGDYQKLVNECRSKSN